MNLFYLILRYTLLFIISICFFGAAAQVPGFRISQDVTTITSAITKDTISRHPEDKVYITPEIIKYNYLDLEKKPKKKSLATLKDSLYKNSRGTTTPKLKDDEIKKMQDQIAALTKELEKIESKQDSLYYLYTKDYVNFKRAIVLGFGPLRSRAFFDILYDNEGKIIKVLNNTGLNFGSNTAALYSEFVSGSLGLFRVSLGAMVVSNSDQDPDKQKKEEAYQRLATYGGNTVLNIEYPLAYLHSRNKQFNFLSRFLAKGSADFPAFGTTTDKVAGSASYGIDFYGDASTSNNALRFFFNFNMHRIKGTSVYKDNLGVGNSAFNYGQLIVGLVVAEKFKLSFIVNTLSSESTLRNSRLIGGGQVLH